MFARFIDISHLFRITRGRIVLGTLLAGMGSLPVAEAHHHDGPFGDLHVNLDFGGGRAELDHRHWCPPVYEQRPTRVWIDPVYQSVPGDRVWVAPVYRTVVDHVWREPLMRDEVVRVWVEPSHEDHQVGRGRHSYIERIYVPGHYEEQHRQVIVQSGHYEDVTRQELVADGHWQVNDRQELVAPGHFEERMERVCVSPGHWDDRPMVRIETRFPR